MLASEFRLTEPEDFDLVRHHGKRFISTNFILSFRDRKDTNPTRFGFVIPTKVTKLASDRNRIKRVLSESTRHNLVYVRPGFDCVYLPKNSILRAYANAVMTEVRDALINAGLTTTK
jgi:ribonuclease P protein component